MSEVMGDDVAELELESIMEFLDAEYSGNEKDIIKPVIKEGRFFFDENQKRVIFKLKSPIEKGSEMLGQVKIKVMTPEDDVRINSGFIAKVSSASGLVEMDMGQYQQRTIKAISVLTGEPLGLINRFSRKDFKFLSTVFNFLD